MSILVSLATGFLLGNVFFHLLPESDNYNYVLLGLLSFFLLEKVLRWHHCHHPGHHHPLTVISLVGGLIHSLVDGALITTGFGALLAVVLHELPQKISYYSIFIHQKISPPKALALSVSTSLPAVFSALLFLFLNSKFEILNLYLIPFAAGAFIYLAVADLIPELHRHSTPPFSILVQFLLILAGLFLIRLL